MSGNLRNFSTKFEGLQIKREGQTLNSDDIDVDFDTASILPVEDAFVYCKEKDGGNERILPAIDFNTGREELMAAMRNGNIISYVNGNGAKVHAEIFYYGPEDLCRQYKQNHPEFDHQDIKRARTLSPQVNQSLNPLSDTPTTTDSKDGKSGGITKEELSNFLASAFDKLECALDAIGDFADDVKFIKELVGSSSTANSSYSPIKEYLEADFKTHMHTKRSQKEWRKKIESTPIDFVDDETARSIRQLFLYGTDDPGSFARNLASYIFDKDILVKTLMGKDGKFLKPLKTGDRTEIFTAKQELQVLNLFKLIDEELFTRQDAFEYLIRSPINQLGRDLKRKFHSKKSQNPNAK